MGGIYALGTGVAVLDFCNFFFFLVEIDFRDLFLVLRTPFGNQLLLLSGFNSWDPLITDGSISNCIIFRLF